MAASCNAPPSRRGDLQAMRKLVLHDLLRGAPPAALSWQQHPRAPTRRNSCKMRAMSYETYVSRREGVYRVAGTRVSLDSIVHAFLNGQTAESIAQSFPVLDLEQVYGAITFYLAHRAEVDAYLLDGRSEYERLREAAHQAAPAFYQKLAGARQHQP
jgi:uncharacterized protein (DUF433 family)